MNTKVMEYILAIAEEQSITRAAERFYLSQADMSRHLKNVEKEMGAPLFTRTSSGVRLTQAGIIFINDVQLVLHMEHELEETFAAMRRQKRSHVRVVADAPFYNRFVQIAGPRFQELRPGYSLEISAGNASQARRALLTGTADLGVFCSTAATAADLEYLNFRKTDVYLLFPRKYTGPTDVEGLRSALADGMFLSLYPAGTTARTLGERQLALHRIFPEHILEGNSGDCIAHVSGGGACGILFAPEITMRDLADDVRPRLGDVFFRVNHVIAYAPRNLPSMAVQDMMQIILETFSD